MMSELNLKGNELLIFACIYSFTVHGSKYYGSLKHLAERANCTLRQVQNVLAALTKRGLLTKEYVVINKTKHCVYSTTVQIINEFESTEEQDEGSDEYTSNTSAKITNMNDSKTMEKISEGYGNNFMGGMEIISTNNKIDNKNDKIKERETRTREEFEHFFSEYPRQQAKERAWQQWCQLAFKGELSEAIFDGLASAKKFDARFKQGERFIPLAVNWLSGREWQNRYDENVVKSDIDSQSSNRVQYPYWTSMQGGVNSYQAVQQVKPGSQQTQGNGMVQQVKPDPQQAQGSGMVQQVKPDPQQAQGNGMVQQGTFVSYRLRQQGGSSFHRAGLHGGQNAYPASSPYVDSSNFKAMAHKNRALNYPQKNYSLEELKALGVDFGDDVYED